VTFFGAKMCFVDLQMESKSLTEDLHLKVGLSSNPPNTTLRIPDELVAVILLNDKSLWFAMSTLTKQQTDQHLRSCFKSIYPAQLKDTKLSLT